MKKGEKKIAAGKEGPDPTPVIKKSATPTKSSPSKSSSKKKKDVVVVDASDDEESENDEDMIPFDAFADRLEQKIGDDRDLVNALIHKLSLIHI